VIVYAESSAVLAWLLGETAGSRVSQILGKSEIVVVSDLTILECERALIRALALHEINPSAAGKIRARLDRAAAHWHLWRISSEILQRARHPFPTEPVRTLDALHLASALAARSAIPGLELLSLDECIRRAGEQLGFRLHPA